MRSRSRLRGVLLAGAVGWLAGFHVWLLARRIADQSLAQPAILARWLAAVLLLAIGAVLWRRGLGQRHRGRMLLAFWLLAALLHVGLPAEARILTPAQDLSAVLPLGLAALPAAILVALALLLAGARGRDRVGAGVHREPAHPVGVPFLDLLAPRPPPAV